MMGRQLKSGRELKGWSQEYAARRLGVSQPYLSMLERDERRVPEQLARKAAGLYRLSAAMLPTTLTWDSVPPADEDTLALDLAALGLDLDGLRGLGRSRQGERSVHRCQRREPDNAEKQTSHHRPPHPEEPDPAAEGSRPTRAGNRAVTIDW